MKFNLAQKMTGLLLMAFTMAACSGRHESVDVIDQVKLNDTYDLRHSFPEAPAADVTGFEATFTGQHNGVMTVRTLQIPCNAFLGKSIEENASSIPSSFGMSLTKQGKIQTEDVMLQAKNGVCLHAPN